MMNLKWYCHQSHSCEAQIEEELERLEQEGKIFMKESAKPKLAQELYNFFYEVEFDIKVNEFTGKIMEVTIAPKNRHESEKIRK